MILQSSQEPTPTWHLIFLLIHLCDSDIASLSGFTPPQMFPLGLSANKPCQETWSTWRDGFWHQFGQRSEVEKTNRTTDTMFVNVENNESSEKVETSCKASDASLDIKTLSEECSYNIDWGIVLSGMPKIHCLSLSLSKYLHTHTYIFMRIPYRPYTI